MSNEQQQCELEKYEGLCDAVMYIYSDLDGSSQVLFALLATLNGMMIASGEFDKELALEFVFLQEILLGTLFGEGETLHVGGGDDTVQQLH